MNKLTLTALSAAMCLALNGGAMAAFGKYPEYKAAKDQIEAKYKTDKAACKAELDQKLEPSTKHANDVRMAKAKAAYEVEKEKCDDMSGNQKDVCRKEAKAHYIAAKSDAKVVESTADANKKVANVKKDAAEDKSDAGYAAAKEKCDAMSGDTKDNCIKQAKARYGKA